MALTTRTALSALQALVTLRDLRTTLTALDEDIDTLRRDLQPASSQNGASGEIDGKPPEGKTGRYDAMEDVEKMARLVVAKEKTKATLTLRQAKAGRP